MIIFRSFNTGVAYERCLKRIAMITLIRLIEHNISCATTRHLELFFANSSARVGFGYMSRYMSSY